MEDTVKRTIAVTIAGLFLGIAVLGADHQRNPKKHQDSTRLIVSGDHGGDSGTRRLYLSCAMTAHHNDEDACEDQD
jgi:hypothetical protein